MKLIVVVSMVLVLSGCASHPERLPTTYVPPLQYLSYDCDQLDGEFKRVSIRVHQLYESLKAEADVDELQMRIGLLFFWPTLFWLEGGDGPEAIEYSQLKGEYAALEEVAIQKKCSSDIIPPNPEEQLKEDERQKALEQQRENMIKISD